MKNQNELLYKIKSPYIGDGYAQIMIPYQNAITILSSDGIMFYQMPNFSFYINEYLSNDRRNLK